MKTNSTNPVQALLALVLFSSFSFAQTGVPFKMRYQSTIKGDMTVIANGITNRVDANGSALTPYNKIDNAMLNDEFEMSYIDIDSDETTFSSSSATLELENSQNKKVVYAGLYWSATYKFNPGVIKEEGKFVAISNKRDAIKQVKIKLPNQDEYTDVVGEVIFDGNKSKAYKENAPYAVYADVTSLMTSLVNPNGSYTVANVRATNGKIEGGVASGWTLFVVYEDDQMPEKFVASYDGFANINENNASIKISGFSATQQGKVNAKIACAALEGDANLKNDQLYVSSASAGLVAVGSETRNETNVFNSSISNEKGEMTNRYPNSKNTLGYDTFVMEISNADNANIDNNSNETILKFASTGDRTYVFFTAFNVEVGNASPTVVSNTKSEKIDFSNETIADAYQTNMMVTTMTEKYEVASVDKNVQIQAQSIPNQKSGYYVVANVFSDPYFAKEFIKTLKSQGVEADYFVNPENGFRYVYVTKTANEQDAVSQYLALADTKYQGKTWVLSVNNKESFTSKTMLASEE
ncbi:MAG: hypothetical protein O9267_03045 [Flavobacterium sp.]|uniref:hypothetical protein n=1 Tax=Flavobacterium sp. TaxID=239 RepID=UPI0022BD7628|nr:hypothetical protein [Flavobacterium sp.]MCZ8196570.1 hypothetical protein [Flavobacterium sp.]